MVTIKVYEGETMREGASLALLHRLYVSGWSLSYELTDARHNPRRNKLAIAFKSGTPVAVAFLDEHRQLMAFCKKAERGQGFASQCVKAIKPTRNCWAGEGVYGTLDFWRQLGVSCSRR